ncbi:EamA family transporter [Streptomyces zagrosensis]|uniref:Drug/metabolite transporter (DMT)-like permease n=1 Tax=Streptomyces zagrosensis TaxID=1042984 RepID=A0A7W9QA93_9ACTN|nr:EamA family transporter [Streptomyces zagrosensis]MBB5936533.1 drug/metabolite transporter (DMT)-like permease [Streptomyces zagrosensis]
MTSAPRTPSAPVVAGGGGPAAGVALAVVSACTFGTVGPATKMLDAAGLSALETAQFRLTVTAVLLLAYTAITRPRQLRATRQEWAVIAVLGVFSFAALQTLCGVAVARIPVGVFVVVQFLSPVIVVLWLRWVRRIRQPPLVWAGTAVVLSGLLLVGEVWARLRLDVIGVLAALGTALALSVRFLVARQALEHRDPVAVAALGTAVAALALNVLSPPTAFRYAALGEWVAYGRVSAPVWAVAGWAAVVATLVAYLSGIAAQRFLAPSTASLFATLEVVAGAGVAYVLLSESLSAPQCAGIATVLAGVLLAQRAMRAQPPPVPARPGCHAAVAPGERTKTPAPPR